VTTTDPLSLTQAKRLASNADTLLLRATRAADLETPIGAFLRLDDGTTPAYLLESVEGGETWGRYIASDGDRFPILSAATPGTANALPALGAVVITEIMYDPASNNPDEEYIELYNNTDSAIALQGPDSVPWAITNGVEFNFPIGASIPAHGYVIVASNPTAFLAAYGNLSVTVFGPFAGREFFPRMRGRLRVKDLLHATPSSGCQFHAQKETGPITRSRHLASGCRRPYLLAFGNRPTLHSRGGGLRIRRPFSRARPR
jgi:hypothetical protein